MRKLLVLCGKSLSEFSYLYVLKPLKSEKTVCTNYQIELSFGILYRDRKSKDEFFN